MGFHALDNLSKDELRTEVIFSFLRKLMKVAKDLKSNKFAFCWDSRQSYRRLMYSDYKGNRKPVDDDEKENRSIAFKQFNILRKEVLPNMGFKNIYRQTGFEADDLMAQLAKDNRDSVIVSTDQDMYQLLDCCEIYNPRTNKVIKQKDFRKEYDVSPADWITVKALAGCSSDNVAGIVGVGEKKAIAYIHKKLPKGVIFDRIESKEGKEIKKRNIKLVTLPYIEKPMKELVVQKDELTTEKFINVFDKYDFQSFLRQDAWERWKVVFEI